MANRIKESKTARRDFRTISSYVIILYLRKPRFKEVEFCTCGPSPFKGPGIRLRSSASLAAFLTPPQSDGTDSWTLRGSPLCPERQPVLTKERSREQPRHVWL